MTPQIQAGDLCVIVGEQPQALENIGALLTVKAPRLLTDVPSWGFENPSRPLKAVLPSGECVWLTDSDHVGIPGCCAVYPARYLRRIGNPEGADETLSWRAVPKPVSNPAPTPTDRPVLLPQEVGA